MISSSGIRDRSRRFRKVARTIELFQTGSPWDALIAAVYVVDIAAHIIIAVVG
jgi:hypothetical protein